MAVGIMMANSIDDMRTLIENFQKLSDSKHGERLIHMSDFITTFSEIRVRNRRTMKPRFSVFDVLQVGADEVRHSSILAWLCDADSYHGLGNVFFKELLDTCSVDIPSSVLADYDVRTEFRGNESIIDVMISKAGEFIIYLENKIFAEEGVDQLNREYRDMRYFGDILRVPEGRQYAIFLTRNRLVKLRTGDPKQWSRISYPDLSVAVQKTAEGTSDLKLKGFLEDLAETYSTWSSR
jgi:hypothetical protein